MHLCCNVGKYQAILCSSLTEAVILFMSVDVACFCAVLVSDMSAEICDICIYSLFDTIAS